MCMCVCAFIWKCVGNERRSGRRVSGVKRSHGRVRVALEKREEINSKNISSSLFSLCLRGARKIGRRADETRWLRVDWGEGGEDFRDDS